MKKKDFFIIGVILVNIFIGTIVSFTVYAEEPIYYHLTWVQCNCDTGETAPGNCTKGICNYIGINEWCLVDVPCGNPPEYPEI